MWEGNTAIKATGWWQNGLKQFFRSTVKRLNDLLSKFESLFHVVKTMFLVYATGYRRGERSVSYVLNKYGWSTSH